MRLFNSVALEITSRCNRRCKFCPVAYNSRPDERMNQKILVKALTELGHLGYRGRIELYIYNEPLLDRKWFFRCLATVRSLVPRSCIMIATNGDYLKSSKDIIFLFDCGLNQLLINCYSPGLFARRRAWLADLPKSVSRTNSVYAVLSSKSKTVEMVDKSDTRDFGTGVFCLVNRAGNIPKFLAVPTRPVVRMCVKPFRFLNINWRGEALVCCQDYHADVSYGSVASSTLVDLWNHPILNEYRHRLLVRDRGLPLCRLCDCPAGAYTYNVDHKFGKGSGSADVKDLHCSRQHRRKEKARTNAG